MTIPLHARINIPASRIGFLAVQHRHVLPPAVVDEILRQAMSVCDAAAEVEALEAGGWIAAHRARRARARERRWLMRLWQSAQRLLVAL